MFATKKGPPQKKTYCEVPNCTPTKIIRDFKIKLIIFPLLTCENHYYKKKVSNHLMSNLKVSS